MQHLKNILITLSVNSSITADQKIAIDKYVAKIDKLVQLYTELNDRHPLIVDRNTDPEDVIRGLNEKYHDPKFYAMMDTLASLEFDREKINVIAGSYENDLIRKNADYRRARTTLAPILKPDNPARGTQVREVSTFTSMPMQNLPRISMVVRAVNEQLIRFRDSAPDYHANEEGVDGPKVALQELIACTEGCVGRSGPKNTELQQKVGEKTVANLVDALYAKSESGWNAVHKANFFIREILHLNLNTPRANNIDARIKDFPAYLETVLVKCYPGMFSLNAKEELTINGGTNHSRYLNMNMALGVDVFRQGAEPIKLNPANFNAAKLDQLYRSDHNMLWLVLKSTKPIDPSFTAEEKVRTFIDLANAYKNQKNGEKEHDAEAYKLAQTAIAIGQDNPGCQTLIHEAFGPSSELGQWLIAKQAKHDQAIVRENLSQFSHAKFLETIQPPSHKKIVISPSQALLLIDHYQMQRNRLAAVHVDPEQLRAADEKIAELKKLYLVGVRVAEGETRNQKFEINQDDLLKMQEYLAEPTLSSYVVSKDRMVINNDPTRRYFETHLSYETVKNNIDGMSKELLETHVAKLTESLAAHEKDARDCADVFSNSYHGDSKLHHEYANYLAKIERKEIFSELNDEQREKIMLVIKSSLLGVANALARGQELPINIYNTAPIYGNWRGKEAVRGQETTENGHMGLMRNHMPIGQGDIATSDHPAPPVKPSDQSTYKDDGDYAKWVEMNFAGLVHPFSNAISGTVLCQLRNMAEQRSGDKINSSGITDSAAQIGKYTQVFIAAMLYGSGGHSLNEYTYPFQLQEVRDQFAEVEGFNDINLESLFLSNNEESFDQSLNDTIVYNAQFLQRQRLNQDVSFVGAHQDKVELAKAIEVVTQKIEKYESEVDKQWFSQHRASREKLGKMKPMADEIRKALNAGNVNDALNVSTKLMTMLEREYGKTGFRGSERLSYRLAKEMHETLTELDAKSSRKKKVITANQNFKERMQEIKGLNEQGEEHHRVAGL